MPLHLLQLLGMGGGGAAPVVATVTPDVDRAAWVRTASTPDPALAAWARTASTPDPALAAWKTYGA